MTYNRIPPKLKVATRATLLVSLTVAMTAHAGIKYWDNPAFRAFDVGDYAPGAVWHFDGIRNQGADQPHSTTATTWKNIGSSGVGPPHMAWPPRRRRDPRSLDNRKRRQK